MRWEFNNDKPIYAQIMEQMKLFIVSGALRAGQKLASVRELAAEAEVNPNTIQKALAELERTGLIVTHRTSGRVVTEDEAMIQAIKKDLAKAQIDAFFTSMEKLGFDKKQTMELLEENEEGEQHE